MVLPLGLNEYLASFSEHYPNLVGDRMWGMACADHDCTIWIGDFQEVGQFHCTDSHISNVGIVH